MRDILIRVAVLIAAVLLAYGAGVYSVNTKIVTRVEYQTVDKIVEKEVIKFVEKKQEKTTWSTVQKDGTTISVTKEVSLDTQLAQSSQVVKEKRVNTIRSEERILESKSKYSLQLTYADLLGVPSMDQLPRLVNVELGSRLFGPTWLTFSRISNGHLGIGIRYEW